MPQVKEFKYHRILFVVCVCGSAAQPICLFVSFVMATVREPEALPNVSFIGVIHSGAASPHLFETGG